MTLSELIKECGRGFERLTYNLDDTWRASNISMRSGYEGNKTGKEVPSDDFKGKTPEEAVEKLLNFLKAINK